MNLMHPSFDDAEKKSEKIRKSENNYLYKSTFSLLLCRMKAQLMPFHLKDFDREYIHTYRVFIFFSDFFRFFFAQTRLFLNKK